ncbi:MAG: hypothetical protein HOI95_27860 [Chromatiales bacterium]|jgi:hypothetical protein|nr:hypothetical protein [Chromatiales bacterium]
MSNGHRDPLVDEVNNAYGVDLSPDQCARARKVAASVRATLDATAPDSLFDTEPSNLRATLSALAANEEGAA